MAVKVFYTKYSDNQVFTTPSVNVICNQLMQGLADKAFTNLNDHFGLSGSAATHYQNDTDGPIQNIQFTTDQREIYLFIANNLKTICPSNLSLQVFEERIIAGFKDAFIEFYLESSITTTNKAGIYTVNTNEI